MTLSTVIGARPTAASRPRFDAIAAWFVEGAGDPGAPDAPEVDHKLASKLIELTNILDLEPILPAGTFTWKNRGSQRTIDLTFVSKELVETVIS